MAHRITREQYLRLLDRNCNRGKHRLRTNKYGVTWCVICGLLSNAIGVQEATEDDKLIIDCNE